MRAKTSWVAIIVISAAFACPTTLTADQGVVRNTEGALHVLLALRTLDGTLVASGDLIQVARGDQVTAEVVFHFKDGSLHRETTIFSQRDRFRLVSNHLVQKGPAFPRQLNMTIRADSGQVTVRYNDENENEKVEDEHLELPADTANGMMIVLLKNVNAKNVPPMVSYVAATPKPRLVKLALSAVGVESFTVAGGSRRVIHYAIKAEIGGLGGMLAPILGKQPPDNHVWILEGPAPAFVKSEGPLYLGGPSWRIELTSPVSPDARPAIKQ